jgi:insertion element IS1 protein InsB
MEENTSSCIKRVGGVEMCNFFDNCLIKHGTSSANKIRFRCKVCKKTQVEHYSYNAYNPSINKRIVSLTKEGVGIRSTARLLQISTTTLLKRIISIAKSIPNQQIYKGKVYEVDEIRSYLRNKEKPIWIVYALERTTKRVVSFAIGRRTKRTLQNVINTLLLSSPKRIYTDGLVHYKALIGSLIHKVKRFGTNHIERNNLSIRTHLKRLSRKTICFSRSFIVLMCVLRIYFWM